MLVFVVLPCWAAPSFELTDQRGTTHASSRLFASGRTVVFGASSQAHTKPMQRWIDALEGSPRPPMVGMARLAGLPFFVPRALMRRNLRQALPDVPVLCDWTGETWDGMGFVKGGPLNVFVVDERGDVVTRVEGEPSSDHVETIRSALGGAQP